MNQAVAPLERGALAVPSRQELEQLGPGDRWTLEERLEEAGGVLREFNDEELRRWVEVDGKTQKEIAQMVGRSQGRISQRCSRLGIVSGRTNSGERRSIRANTPGGEEVIDAEVVEDDPAPPPRRQSPPSGPAHYFPDVVADDADQNLRTQAMHWFEQGAVVKELLDKRRPMTPRSDQDRVAIRKEAAAMERVARRLKESL